jgi:hypothetical protein
MPDYSKSKLYKIISYVDDFEESYTYYGSTTQSLSTRMASHRKNFNKNIVSTTSRNLFNKYGVDSCFIQLIENFPCKNIEELKQQECKLICNNPCINKQIPLRTKKQYYKENKEVLDEKQKKYKEKNKEKFKEWRRTHYENNKDKRKNYLEENKEKIKLTTQQRVRKVNCPFCNKEMNNTSLNNHKKICKMSS